MMYVDVAPPNGSSDMEIKIDAMVFILIPSLLRIIMANNITINSNISRGSLINNTK
jgi:hypothetical protein